MHCRDGPCPRPTDLLSVALVAATDYLYRVRVRVLGRGLQATTRTLCMAVAQRAGAAPS